jgi:hypothetical protein
MISSRIDENTITVMNKIFHFRSVVVHVYGLKNGITKTVQNLAKDKTFVTNGEFISVLQLSPSKIPTVVINGKYCILIISYVPLLED